MTIVNDDSRVITKLETSLTDDARVIIYDRHMFIVQAAAWVLSMFCNFYLEKNNSTATEDREKISPFLKSLEFKMPFMT